MEFAKVGLSPVPFGAGSEIPTSVTFEHETPFDVNKNKFGQSV